MKKNEAMITILRFDALYILVETRARKKICIIDLGKGF